MKVVVKLNSGVVDVNGKEMICVYSVKENGVITNSLYFRKILYACSTAKLRAELYNCSIEVLVR